MDKVITLPINSFQTLKNNILNIVQKLIKDKNLKEYSNKILARENKALKADIEQVRQELDRVKEEKQRFQRQLQQENTNLLEHDELNKHHADRLMLTLNFQDISMINNYEEWKKLKEFYQKQLISRNQLIVSLNHQIFQLKQSIDQHPENILNVGVFYRNLRESLKARGDSPKIKQQSSDKKGNYECIMCLKDNKFNIVESLSEEGIRQEIFKNSPQIQYVLTRNTWANFGRQIR